MSRQFFVPGIILLFVALVLSFLTSISLPSIHFLDIARIHFGNGQGQNLPKDQLIQEARFGIWGYCYYDLNDDSTCVHTGHGYEFPLRASFDGDTNTITVETIGASWTRGLAVHPVATVFTAIALGLSVYSTVTGNIAAALGVLVASLLAAFLTLLAFIIDIALYAYVHHKVHEVDGRWNVDTAPGFWLTFVSLLCILFATCTIFIGRRKAGDSSPSYPTMSGGSGILSRFRKN
ncbi:hypothetical protein D9758_014469 [Tetrapyrgos nigripes]|uniref:Pali-domain-containing protein n=1 Tax=Tetrapyrgos nigripes TaxID=182062 RepID=A0A8H5C6Z5_9AGAR|nr:hypothetical protein D9758_014469 [Tetrapyrgos nigripes]